ncbi:HNH endonuclease [Limibacterium fermenti]|uniref:HNH endonuclease n=1 Tax=Limibacterium fermenti TaxID=3229863 RepID=UPI003A77B21A
MGRLKHKKGRPAKYRASLKDNSYWEEVKRLVRLRDGYTCQRCGQRYNLEIHHKTYYVDGKSIVGREKDFLYCLELLCENCHQKEHQK